jgi:hypothetical protein
MSCNLAIFYYTLKFTPEIWIDVTTPVSDTPLFNIYLHLLPIINICIAASASAYGITSHL